jgi:flavin-dependent dehydrogenase
MTLTERNRTLNREIGIVGGSAAGLFAGHLLSRAGKRVCIFEGSPKFDAKPRTLIVTHRMRDVLGRIGDSAVVNEIRQFELFTDGRVARVGLRQPDLVIERTSLIRSLAAVAQKSGAEIIHGRRFVSMEQKRGAIGVHLQRGNEAALEEVDVNTLIAADGTISRVARAAGWPPHPTVPLVQAIVRLPEGMTADTTRVWFIPDDTPYFYWLIPDSPTRGVLGLIGEEGPQTRKALEGFLERQHLQPLEYQAAKIPVYTRWTPVRRQLAGGEVYLVGDAAGHVKVTTVGGIVTGLRGALGVAESILAGRPTGRLRALRRELDLHLLIRRVIHNSTQARYSHLVDLLNARTRRDLEGHTRDEPGDVLWRLCIHQPRLLLFGLRVFLNGGSFPSRRGLYPGARAE